MRLLVDARWTGSGIGRCLRALLPGLHARLSGWQIVALGGNAGFGPAAQGAMARALARHRPDVVWCPHYPVPWGWRGPLVVTIHDLLPLLPYPGRPGIPPRLAAWAMLRLALRRADTVLVPSEATRHDVLSRLGHPRGRLVVAPNGVGADWGAPVAGPPAHPRPYLLFLGNHKPHKNLDGLLAAFARIAESVPQDLVLAGARSGRRRPAVPEGLRHRVAVVGPVADARRWIGHADGLVLPSFHEGFGLPPLEAMAQGVPVAVSRAGALPEVCGPAAAYFDPACPASIAEALLTLLTDDALRRRLVAAGAARAALFDWETGADRLAEAVERAAHPSARPAISQG